jgi:uncharacterized protein (DUF885 family)
MESANVSASVINKALGIADDAWEEARRSALVQARLGGTLAQLPDVSMEEAERRSRVGRALLERMNAISMDALPHDLALTLRLVRFNASTWARAADWYWIVIDPVGAGVFGMFLPTAYCGGFMLNFVNQQLREYRFGRPDDCDRYLRLIADYGRLVEQIAARTAGQAERGMRAPKVQAAHARTLISGFKTAARNALTVIPERLSEGRRPGFNQEIERCILTRLEPAFDQILEVFSDDYMRLAPHGVGLGQYEGGSEVYADLVKVYTTLDLSPAQVHERGLHRMTQIERAMEALRTELGFQGDSSEFVSHLSQDPRWRTHTVEGVRAVFQRYIDRLALRFDNYFHSIPRAAYSVAPLPETLQGSMTFGYYDSPTTNRNEGIYWFNSGNLVKQSLFNIGALTYHELIPGHHLHLATQFENQALHPLRRHSLVTAYNEGWAEYAATFAGEVGMYEQIAERYGRLMWDAFFTCRLVVDTGMNAFGWSLEDARAHMRKHTGIIEAEILSESVRYGCDIPAQSLAYKIGDAEILSMREKMRGALGACFDFRDFHAAVLGAGSMPMADLAWHVDYETTRLASTAVS